MKKAIKSQKNFIHICSYINRYILLFFTLSFFTYGNSQIYTTDSTIIIVKNAVISYKENNSTEPIPQSYAKPNKNKTLKYIANYKTKKSSIKNIKEKIINAKNNAATILSFKDRFRVAFNECESTQLRFHQTTAFKKSFSIQLKRWVGKESVSSLMDISISKSNFLCSNYLRPPPLDGISNL